MGFFVCVCVLTPDKLNLWIDNNILCCLNRAISRGENLAPSQKKLAQIMKDIEEEEKMQIVRLGDASIASPFTSKLSTTMCGELL